MYPAMATSREQSLNDSNLLDDLDLRGGDLPRDLLSSQRHSHQQEQAEEAEDPANTQALLGSAGGEDNYLDDGGHFIYGSGNVTGNSMWGAKGAEDD